MRLFSSTMVPRLCTVKTGDYANSYIPSKKSTGFYNLFEYLAPGDLIAKIEIQLKRDERVLRFLTVKLDKHAIAYNEKKRRNKAAEAVAEKEA